MGHTLALAPITRTVLQSVIDQYIELRIERRAKNGMFYTQRTDCPEKLAKLILEAPDLRETHNWPRIERISAVPLFDGTHLVDEPGLHGATWLDCPRGITLPPLTKAAAEAALQRLVSKWLSGFPFASPKDATAGIAGLMLAALRPSLGTAPTVLIDKPSYGAGASTLAKIYGAVLTGLVPPVMAAGDDPAELEKIVTAVLLEGLPFIGLDNLPEGQPLRSSKLAQASSEDKMRPREFGRTTSHEVDTGRLIVCNGVNVLPADDMSRRTIVCRLNPKMERPEQREFARPNIVRDVLAERVEILQDCFTITAAYIASKKKTQVMPLAGYDQFTNWIVRPLVWLGRDDLNAGVRESAAVDPTNQLLAELLPVMERIEKWPGYRGRDGLTLGEMRDRSATTDAERSKRTADVKSLESILVEAVGAREYNGLVQLNSRAAGKFLARVANRVSGGRYLVQNGKSDGAVRWKIERVPEGV